MCKDIMDFSHGKQKVKSSGIMEFGVSRDQYEPNVFYTWERYDSNRSLGRHNTSPEFQAFMENVTFPFPLTELLPVHLRALIRQHSRLLSFAAGHTHAHQTTLNMHQDSAGP